MDTDPLQGGPTPSPNPGADPVKVLAPLEPGAPTPDDHDVSGPPSPETIKRGYEEDVYDAKTVLSVPLLVVLFFVLAFGTVTILFYTFRDPTTNPNAHPQAQARNKADLNTRIGRIKRGGEVDQPGLEPMKQRSGDPRAITRPELPGVNSPELHPEDLIPNKDRHPELYSADAGRVGLDKLLDDKQTTDDKLKGLFKTQANGSKVVGSQFVPSGANAGRGAESSVVVSPKAPEAKQPDPKPKGTEPAPPPKGKEGKP